MNLFTSKSRLFNKTVNQKQGREWLRVMENGYPEEEGIWANGFLAEEYD